MSDSVNGDRSSRSLFPKDFQEELNITNIRLMHKQHLSYLFSSDLQQQLTTYEPEPGPRGGGGGPGFP